MDYQAQYHYCSVCLVVDTQRECDYASFTPDALGGPGLDGFGLWADDRRLSISALSQSLMHVQGVLVAAGRDKEAFAVQAILEHVSFQHENPLTVQPSYGAVRVGGEAVNH